MNLSPINEAFMRLTKRAESQDKSKLVSTFVDIGPLFTLLSTKDHQIIYGRRGTGKTHALTYLSEKTNKKTSIPIYIDMRTIGSTGGLYADTSLPLSQRATRLLCDSLATIQSTIHDFCIENSEEVNLAIAGPILDDLADSITEVNVVGNVEIFRSKEEQNSHTLETGVSINTKDLSGEISISDKSIDATNSAISRKESGKEEYRVHFGRVHSVVSKMITQLNKDILILIDEWSSLPIDLQPYLADLLRRALFPITGLTTKIAAIEQRSAFSIRNTLGDYIGIELGADASIEINLDDYMVFDNDPEKSKKFFSNLLFKHISEIDEIDQTALPKDEFDFVSQAFTQVNAFEEFVRSTEGVPRDAINIISLAAQKALDQKISIPNVRVAARNWFQRDKEAAVKSNREAYTLLHWIIDEVIGLRSARGFLLQNDSKSELIDSLFDSRVLHILKRNISGRDVPGLRFDAYKLDYGCYVDLISTKKSPFGLFEIEQDDGFIGKTDVPLDDYRAIRRAILNISDFLSKTSS